VVVLFAAVHAVALLAEGNPTGWQPAPKGTIGPSAPSTGATLQNHVLQPIASSGKALNLNGYSSSASSATAADNAQRSAALSFPSTAWPAAESSSPDVDCFQILANSELNVVELGDLGDGTGNVEPWVIVNPIVYYFRDDSVSPPNYFLYIQDTIEGGADAGDETPNQDVFGQGFVLPDNLVSLQVVYDAATLNSEEVDKAYGYLWHIDENDNLPDDGGIVTWENPDPAGSDDWARYTVDITQPAFLSQLSGNKIALLFYNDTDGFAPEESVFFDNIILNACVPSKPAGGRLFLPSVFNVVNTDPVCVPPSEVPRDEVDANRGLVQARATCNTTLSQLDTQDYYTFVPQQGGNYTLQLNPPDGTEWSASVIEKVGGSYAYAPGPTGGQCRIATPGDVDKQVTCGLQAGREYVVKVSAGQYSGVEKNYIMQVVR
jgi:hypothetical protein